jgi:hypothetical protein
MNDPRLILSARRPDGDDDADPEIAAAISAAQSDPKIAEWSEKQTAVDRRISGALRSVQPPAGLRDRILTGAKVSRKRDAGSEGWFEKKVWGFFGRGELAAVALVIVLLATAVIYNRVTDKPDERPWQVFAVAKAAQLESGAETLEHKDAFLQTTVEWMREQACPAPYMLPEGLQSLGLFGCSTMKWNGKQIGIVCFKLGAEHEVHLVCIDAKDIPDLLTERPMWTEIGGYTTAQWREKDTAFMLLGRVPRAELERLLETKTALRKARRILLQS